MESSLTLVLVLVVAGLALWLSRERSIRRGIEDEIPDMLKEAEDQAVAVHRKKSGRTRVALAVEQFAPLLEGFEYDPSDARIISGGPIDYVVFDGLTEGHVREIVFVDVKTGSAGLSTEQRRVRDCLRQRRVAFATFEVGPAGVAHMKRAELLPTSALEELDEARD